MRKTTIKFLRNVFVLIGLVSLTTIYSCKEDDEPIIEDAVASFQYEISETNFLEVAFTNYSQNATSYSWNFGDENTSIEESPTHTYVSAGTYKVVLTSINSANVSVTYEQDIMITDPNEALKLLTGDVSKTWKLFREGVCMSMGKDETAPASEWPGFENDGSRPCLYNQTFTFGADGSFVFDDGGFFWGEWGIFPKEECFEAIAANMVNSDDVDVSAWLSGAHSFEFDASTGKLTLTGLGAFIGICKLGETDYTTVPLQSTSCTISITEETGYDLMTVVYNYGEYAYWPITYVSYSDVDLEPEVVTVSAPWGEDLADVTPSSPELDITFAAPPTGILDTITSNSTIEYGVADPAGSNALVGKFNRTDAKYQEQQFRTSPDLKDIQFDNFTTVSFDVYFPAANTYTTLTKTVEIGFGDISETKAGWWTAITGKFVDDTDVTLDTWKTFSFDLTDAKTSTKLDMFYINIGAADHTETGTFYIRNLVFK